MKDNEKKDFMIKLKEDEISVLYRAIKTHLNWGPQGCFGDGDTISDVEGAKIAKKILEKIKKII